MRLRSLWLSLLLALGGAGLTGCETPRMTGIQDARVGMLNAIRAEPPGDYYIGRRLFKKDYKFWGYVRRPGQPWSSAK
ncbi:MAG: hypothetical protein M3463_08085, partial [Verrucomicrobiota bacterium]|nr:hypothetical protein [Verrucomicrobiota bacterium]